MKRLFVRGVSLLFLLFCFPFFCAAGENFSSISVIRTDLYPSGARIVFSVPASGVVRFQLPGAFDIASVRPAASEGVKVFSFETAEISRPQWIPPVLEELFRTIREKENERAVHSGKISAIERSLELLSGPLPKELKGTDIAEYIESVRNVREKMEMERIELAASLEEIRKELSVLQAEFEQKLPPSSHKAIEVTALLSGKGSLLVEAFTRHAEWRPFYRMNLDSTTGIVSGALFARARQKTGLLIEGSVNFNTSMPSASVSPPELRPLVADFAPKARDTRRSAMMDEVLPSVAFMAPIPEAAPAPPPAVLETLTDLSVQAEGILNGDFTFADFNLGEFSLESETSIVSVPVLSEQAWLVAELKSLPFALLPGTVELSVDGQSSGTTSLREHGSGSDLEIAFGKTPRVKAVRERIVPTEGSTWTGRGRLEDGYTIEVSNGMPHAVAVKIQDRMPVSSREKIAIETATIDPKPDEQSDRNLLTWNFSLSPGEKRSITVKFRLIYPSDETVIFR